MESLHPSPRENICLSYPWTGRLCGIGSHSQLPSDTASRRSSKESMSSRLLLLLVPTRISSIPANGCIKAKSKALCISTRWLKHRLHSAPHSSTQSTPAQFTQRKHFVFLTHGLEESLASEATPSCLPTFFSLLIPNVKNHEIHILRAAEIA
ncbi:hypothetical protein E2320_016954 [Naja naja]|nr:hypothetical protein E2320_016954 [Naja naja]